MKEVLVLRCSGMRTNLNLKEKDLVVLPLVRREGKAESGGNDNGEVWEIELE